MPYAESDPSPALPRWQSIVLALIPVLPPLYLLAFGALGRLRQLSSAARWVLLIFAISQIVAALFTPDPLVSLVATSVRTLFILAMISAGVYLQDSRNLRPLIWGEVAILLSAWAYSLKSQGIHSLLERLSHPYYYEVSLGLVGVITIWLSLFWRGGAQWWRWTVGALGLATLLASGSRGPLLALLFGTVIAFMVTGRKQARNWLLAAAAALAGVAYLASRPGMPSNPVGRFIQSQSSGRNYVWQDAWAGFKTSPVGGVGPYQGGPYLTFLFKDGCQLNPALEKNNVQCPKWLTNLNGVWLIAHNAWLHWLLETGLIGTLGMTALYGYGLYNAYRKRDSLPVAILFGYTAMNMVDVVVAAPTPHLAELFWATLGLSLPTHLNAARGVKTTLPAGTTVSTDPLIKPA